MLAILINYSIGVALQHVSENVSPRRLPSRRKNTTNRRDLYLSLHGEDRFGGKKE